MLADIAEGEGRTIFRQLHSYSTRADECGRFIGNNVKSEIFILDEFFVRDLQCLAVSFKPIIDGKDDVLTRIQVRRGEIYRRTDDWRGRLQNGEP